MERVTGSNVNVSSKFSAQKDTGRDESAHFGARRVKAEQNESGSKMKSPSGKPASSLLANDPSTKKIVKSGDFLANCLDVLLSTPIGEFGEPASGSQIGSIFGPLFDSMGSGSLPMSVPCKEFLEETIPCSHCVVRVPRDEHFDYMVRHVRDAHPEELQNYLQNK